MQSSLDMSTVLSYNECMSVDSKRFLLSDEDAWTHENPGKLVGWCLNRWVQVSDTSARVDVRGDGQRMWVLIDLVDIPKITELGLHWRLSPAKAPEGKYYVQSRKQGKVILLHRVILGLTDPAIEGHHINNDGTDNRRCNLEAVSHINNHRARKPNADWNEYDRVKAASLEYATERKIADELGKRFGVSRAMLYKVRRGIGGRKTRAEYEKLCLAAGVRTLDQMIAASPRDGKWGVNQSGGITAA